MIRLRMISVMIFAIGYSVCSTAVLAEQEKPVQEKKVAAETAVVPEIQEDSKALNKTVTKEQDVPAKQKDAKAKKPSAAEERIRKLIETIKEERAATKEEIAAEEQLMAEITGLIIEETMTKIGYEFYEYFFLLWKPPQLGRRHYNILISERASPLWGSWIKVNIDENTVWSRVLRPRSEEIEEAVKEAIEATKNYLQNYQRRQFKSPDLVGTGI